MKEHLILYCYSRDLTFSIEQKQKYLLFSAFKSDLDVFGAEKARVVSFAPVLHLFFIFFRQMTKWCYEIIANIPACKYLDCRKEEWGNGQGTLLVIFLFIFFSLFSALKADFDKEDVLRKLFWKARAKARVVLKEQLAEFRDKRAAGLGSIFGPPDQELKQCIDNRTKELQVIDELLLPLLESTS